MDTEMHAETIRQIIALEWSMFGAVHNEGGRADCQDDPTTFSIMRASQLGVWSDETLESYLQDLQTAQAEGRNLPEEKYGYMMRSTAPAEFARIASRLPSIPTGKAAQIEALVTRQLAEVDALALCYPHFIKTMRSLHTTEDTPESTSFETYLRGELSTYSQHTLACYERQLTACGGDYSRRLLETTARLYGYPSLDAVEAQLAKNNLLA